MTDPVRRAVRRMFRAHMKYMGRPRFITKNTSNTMHTRYLREVFPDAFFVHIIRNGYAVANSLSRVAFWRNLELWWSERTAKEWEEEGRSRYELCALQWRAEVSALLSDKEHLPCKQYCEIRFEDLVTDTEQQLQRVVEFCELDWNDNLRRYLHNTNIRKESKDRWRKQLDAAAKKAIARAAGDLLTQLGYVCLSLKHEY